MRFSRELSCFFESKGKDKLCCKGAFMSLVFSNFSDCLSAMLCVVVYGVMTQHTDETEMVVGMG